MVRRRRPLVPGSEAALDRLQEQVLPSTLGPVKYEVAKELGIPLQRGYNGQLTTREAGSIGGPIGGAMVKELIRIAERELLNERASRY